MAYEPHVKFTVSGTLGPVSAPVEIFSMGLSIGRDGPPGALVPLPAVGVQNLVETAFAGMFSNAALCISDQARIRSYKWASVGPDGRYVGAPTIRGTTVAGASSGAPLPPQSSVVVSLVAGGIYPPVKGRIYLPVPTSAISISGLTFAMSSTVQANMLAAVLTGFQGMNTALTDVDPDYYLAIASQGRALGAIAPQNAPVTQVRVGAIIDTQRRRRNQLAEAYLTADL